MTDSADQVPRYLYRYRSISTKYFRDELERVINNSSIWMSSAADQNDPFDTLPYYYDGKPIENKKLLQKLYKKYPTKFITGSNMIEKARALGVKKRRIKKYLGSSFEVVRRVSKFAVKSFKKNRGDIMFSCFSDRSDSILMWSHYSDNHSGICLEFEVPDKPYPLECNGLIGRIQYKSERTAISDTEILHSIGWSSFHDREIFDESIEKKVMEGIILQKSNDWSYEREWRILHYSTKSGYFSIRPIKLSLVLLGVNVTEENKKIICDICAGKVGVVQMKMSDNEFKILK